MIIALGLSPLIIDEGDPKQNCWFHQIIGTNEVEEKVIEIHLNVHRKQYFVNTYGKTGFVLGPLR